MSFFLTQKLSNLSPEKWFLLIMVIFGIISTFSTIPFTTGDEGYHLSTSYNIFSSKHPESMDIQHLREFEGEYINNAETRNIIMNKVDLKNDGLYLNFIVSPSLIPINIMNIPPGIGILIARIVYPSYGIMDYFARLFNLVFYIICMYLLIRHSKVNKWSIIMLFTVPMLQKISSPSYDIFSFIAIVAFVLNLFNLTNYKSIYEISKKGLLYTLFTIILILFSKYNYLFALFSLFGLPMIYEPVLRIIKKFSAKIRIILIFFLGVILICFTYLAIQNFHLFEIIKFFFNTFLNIETTGRRARQMWSVIPSTLPSALNILWILSAFLVVITEQKKRWKRGTIFIFSMVYFINWIGIFIATIFLSNNTQLLPVDSIGGRYLSPFLIFFLPLIQNFGTKYKIELPEKNIKKIAIFSTVVIMVAFLVIGYYRGFFLHVNPSITHVG
jgi:uncharacterized membrane protein